MAGRLQNMLLIVVDSLRADAMNAEVMPLMSKEATAGVSFTRAYAPAANTQPSVASILTGLWPFQHGVQANGAWPIGTDVSTRPELLSRSGVRCWASVTGPLLPELGYGRGFADFRYRRESDTLLGHAERDWVLRCIRERESPWFGLVHLWNVHYPRRALPEHRGSVHGRRIYERAARSADRVILELLVEARGRGAAVCLASDHGENLRLEPRWWRLDPIVRHLKTRGFLGLRRPWHHIALRMAFDRWLRGDWTQYHGYTLYEHDVRVPLLFWSAGCVPAAISVPVSTRNVLHALEAFASEPRAAAVRSRLGAGDPVYISACPYGVRSGPGPGLVPAPSRALEGCVAGAWKMWRGQVDGRIRARLYDVERDPGELRNVARAEPERLKEMSAVLGELREAATRLAANAGLDPGQSADVEARLRDLGYFP